MSLARDEAATLQAVAATVWSILLRCTRKSSRSVCSSAHAVMSPTQAVEIVLCMRPYLLTVHRACKAGISCNTFTVQLEATLAS